MLLALVLSLLSHLAWADSVEVLKGDPGWKPFPKPQADIAVAQHWNNWSIDDNHECNIGYWLSQTGGCQANDGRFFDGSPGITPDSLGDTTTQWNFKKSPQTSSVTVTTSTLQVDGVRQDRRTRLVQRQRPQLPLPAVPRAWHPGPERDVLPVGQLRLLRQVARGHVPEHGRG